MASQGPQGLREPSGSQVHLDSLEVQASKVTRVLRDLKGARVCRDHEVRQEGQDSLESRGPRDQLARMDFQERKEALEQ